MLRAHQLTCERGGRTLFRELSLEIAPGELVRVAGENGSGKTSLLRILCGLLAPAAGEVRWKGESIRELREDFSRELVFLGHAPAVKEDLTPAENLAIACRIAGIDASQEAIRGALQSFGLNEHRPVRTLSQGQRRRAALARLRLAERQPLWLLDEPFTALDVASARLTEELIAAHVARGASVVYTTHQEARLGGRVVDLGTNA